MLEGWFINPGQIAVFLLRFIVGAEVERASGEIDSGRRSAMSMLDGVWRWMLKQGRAAVQQEERGRL